MLTGFQGGENFQGRRKSSKGEGKVPGGEQEFQGGEISGSHPVYILKCENIFLVRLSVSIFL